MFSTADSHYLPFDIKKYFSNSMGKYSFFTSFLFNFARKIQNHFL